MIETKNYKGWIFGGELERCARKKFIKRALNFQNPLHQIHKARQSAAKCVAKIFVDVDYIPFCCGVDV